MTSLKSYAEVELATLLETTLAALYERQRVLVRAGLLDLRSGWGPGSGVRTTPSSVALLLIAVLATENLSDVEVRAREIASTKVISGVCKLTRVRSFRDALAVLLASKDMADRVVEVTVSRTSPRAQIEYLMRGLKRTSYVTEFASATPSEPALEVRASIKGDTIRAIFEGTARARSEAHTPYITTKQIRERG